MLQVSQWWFRENPRDWCLQNKEDTLAVNVSSGEHFETSPWLHQGLLKSLAEGNSQPQEVEVL